MFDLDREIRAWKKKMHGNESLEDGYVVELEEHLRDRYDALVEGGVSPADAFAEAARRIGSPAQLGEEYYKTDTRSLTGRPPWRSSLFRNYLMVALRKFRQQKLYAVINIAGLAVGLACCLLILLWVKDEMSYDRYYPHADRIYRVITTDHTGGGQMKFAGSPSLLAGYLLDNYPEVEAVTRIQAGWPGWNLHLGDRRFTEERLAAADPSFFEVFGHRFLAGNREHAFDDRYSIVLTESLARKCFGDEDPLGRTIKMSDTDLTVTGVVADVSANSHIQFDYVFPAVNMADWRESDMESWSYIQFATYLRLKPGMDAAAFNARIRDLVRRHAADSPYTLELQALADVHLQSTGIESWPMEYPHAGNMIYVVLFNAIALCILALACINYMNLATARAVTRAREVGIRKTVGAGRWDLVKQFYGESFLVTGVAMLAAVGLVLLALPVFNRLSGKELDILYLLRPWNLLGLLGLGLVTALVSGSYPALLLASFRTTTVLQQQSPRTGGGGQAFRKLLVISQFVFTSVLLVVTLTIYLQLRFVQTADKGYHSEDIIAFASYGFLGENWDAARQEFLADPRVITAAQSFPLSYRAQGRDDARWEGQPAGQKVTLFPMGVRWDFLELWDIELVDGRFFTRDHPADMDNYLVNESTARVLGWQEPVGKWLEWNGNRGTVIGVLKDVHLGSFHHPIQPVVYNFSRRPFFACVRVQPGRLEGMIPWFHQMWDRFAPDEPFQYSIISMKVAEQYDPDWKIAEMIFYFTGLAVLIACLGLFGLAAFTVERRTKEIGIRKIMGAGAGRIVGMVCREFTLWVILANLLAIPLAWLAAREWLDRFAYRIDLGWEIFTVVLAAALGLALLTVTGQALRAARANPVDALRYE